MSLPKVLVLTGTRADWSKMAGPTRAFVNAKKAGFVDFIDILVTGMHVLPEYGETAKEVVDKILGVRKYFQISNHDLGPEQAAVSIETQKIVRDLIGEHGYTDILIHGDRVEAIAAALTARVLNVRVHHIEGGEITGSVDNDIRYAVTAFAYAHYVCTEGAKKNVLQTGQPADSVFNIGSPEMDRHARPGSKSLKEVLANYSIPFDEYGIVSFHSVTTEADDMLVHAASIFATLETVKKSFIVIMPNNDPGTDAIREVISKILQGKAAKYFFAAPSIRFEDFSTLQKNASLFIGNSSAGVREMPFHGVHSINVGSRQSGRAPNIASITNVDPTDIHKLLRATRENWGRRHERDTTFGDGRSEEKLTAILMTPGHFTRPIQKRLTFNN